MAENEPQESCFTGIKKWFIAFYKTPCFWLKTIPLLTLIVLATFGLYQIATSAFHYFSEPLSHFDSERLGQLGDFLGGTLNPVFGFATVCLLLWSVFIQRKELSLTRDELKKSAHALNMQVELATDEYNRKQLVELLLTLKEKYKKLENDKISSLSIYYTSESGTPTQKILNNIADLIRNQKKHKSAELSEQIHQIMKEDKTINENHRAFISLINITHEIIDAYKETLALTRSKSIQKTLHNQAIKYLENIHILQLLDEDEITKMRNKIDSSIEKQ